MTITSMEPEDYINSWNEMNKEFEEEGTPLRINIPSNEEVVRWLDEEDDRHTIAVNELETAAQLLGGEISHFICVDSKLNKCKKYVITYDRE